MSSALEYISGKNGIRIKVNGKELVVSRLLYSNITNMFYDKEIQVLIVENDKLVIKLTSKTFKLMNVSLEKHLDFY
ncbi:MAG: hypothetical protein RXO36_07660, partial [Candidatus Nanopusillus acidilobi]